MGAYLSAVDLASVLSEAELVQLTDDLGSGAIDSALVDEAIVDAEAEIDGYLQARYTLPLPGEVDRKLLKSLGRSIAVWKLYNRRKLVEEAVTEAYKAAVKLLERIANGTVKLGAAAPPPESGGDVFVSGPDRQFTRDKLGGF